MVNFLITILLLPFFVVIVGWIFTVTGVVVWGIIKLIDSIIFLFTPKYRRAFESFILKKRTKCFDTFIPDKF